jgi:hypothetical protein|tara:strand:- start:691 stop:888 length:198 start_codon:yes stop_codon:yes gene_type:complete
MLKEFMLLTTIIFTTPEKEMTAVVLSEPFEHKAACEERIDRHPFIDFAGVVSMKIIQKCVEAKDD